MFEISITTSTVFPALPVAPTILTLGSFSSTGAFTVTAQVAFLLPSAVVTVIVAVPAAFAVTTPFDTVATLVFDEVQETFLFVALPGATVAVRVSVPPTVRVVAVLLSDTPVTATVVLGAVIVIDFEESAQVR